MRRLVLMVALAGCSHGKSTLGLTVDSLTPIASVDRVSVTFTDVARMLASQPATVAIGGPIPPAKTFNFQFPSSVNGTVHVDAAALAADGSMLSNGSVDVIMTPGQVSSSTLTLGIHASGPPPDPSQSTVTVDRPTGVHADGADAATVTVTLKDGSGMPIGGATVLVTATGGGNLITTPAPTDANGVTTAKLTSTMAETKTVSANGNGVTLTQMPTVQFVAGGVARLAFATQPKSDITGAQLMPFDVVVQDASGTTIPTAAPTVTLAIGANPGGANLLGYPTQTAAAGKVTFSIVGVDQPGKGYTLTASAPGLQMATSSPFDIVRATWQPVSTGLFGGAVAALAVGPTTAGTPAPVWAATNLGVFASKNGGGTWTAASFGLGADANVVTLAADPTDATKVYAASNQGGMHFAMKSTVGGKAWFPLDTPTHDGQVATLIMHPTNPAILFAQNGSALWKSTDAGATWTKLGFPQQPTCLAVDVVTPSTLYACGYDSTGMAYSGAWKSTDGGMSFTQVNNGITNLGLYTLQSTPNALFAFGSPAQVYRSTNGGGMWTPIANGATVAFAPSSPMTVYLATSDTAAVSGDGGATFNTAVTVGGGHVNALAVDPLNAQLVYAGTRNGVYVSTNGGGSWGFASTGITAAAVGAVALDPSSAQRLLASANGATFRSTDGGASWNQVIADQATAFAFDPAAPLNVYACTLSASFYRSSDGGATFGPAIATGGGPYCYTIVIRGAKIWVPTVGGLRASTDSGQTWGAGAVTAPSYSLDADPAGTNLYIGTNAGAQHSSNGGTSFAPMVGNDVTAFLVDQSSPMKVYAGLGCSGTDSGGFMISTNGGTNWSTPMPGACVAQIMSPAATPSHVYFAGRGAPFFYTPDGGATLAGAEDGLPAVDGTSVAVSADGMTAFLGTTGGLYRSTVGF